MPPWLCRAERTCFSNAKSYVSSANEEWTGSRFVFSVCRWAARWVAKWGGGELGQNTLFRVRTASIQFLQDNTSTLPIAFFVAINIPPHSHALGSSNEAIMIRPRSSLFPRRLSTSTRTSAKPNSRSRLPAGTGSLEQVGCSSSFLPLILC